ncbi:phosphotransferase enzyme family protein [Dothidotthia symphoricarpi CBS 119687]|uniref:Phosphotransferase enzyme family protein n=1 Tax=Dothidotthia symphoricarpi CBS 119687 TaxID=1392245 RepID=A0A6A6ALK5_9PLEO|nr:phosphotransferase enzyme family protein [Dothidotthia symphoricarpi CBS 119687]KAF2132436.1 phosphotransferase enzyme family protein [Dothidotthia symphoricarpi CBS 119687]
MRSISLLAVALSSTCPDFLESPQAIGARSCVKIEKLPEGNFNKVFLLSMDDGQELIAKLPNPNAGLAHFTTASEAATMDYVRNVLGIPAPRVYDWSCSKDNPVGSEYILMERSGGVELSKIWDNMPWGQRLEIVRTLVGYEKAFVSASFPMYGSLYYAKDLLSPSLGQFLDPADSRDKREAFVVGPTTNRAFFDQGRDSSEIDRGPWLSINELVHSRAERELACIEKFSSYPSQQGLFGGPDQYRPTKALKVEVLQNYLKVATQILPKDVSLSKPTLWHSDLHTNNIFVDPSQPTKILNIIDWQAVNVSPLFLQARILHSSIPDNFADMNEEDQHQAKSLRAAQSLYKLYEILMLRQCPEIARALRFRDTLPGQITGLASSISSDSEPILQGMLIQLQDKWATYTGSSTPCPLSFTAEDRTQQRRLEASWGEGVELMHELLTEMGAYQGWDGWVNHNNYPMYKERLSSCREKFLNRHAKS